MKERNYLKTLLLPKTDFEMRGKLVEKDAFFFKYFKEKKLLARVANKKSNFFILHDGPPYANGSIHLGHALNKILKDIILRIEVLKGNSISCVAGWDTHGLPIEIEVQKQGITPWKVGSSKYLLACENYAKKQVKIQEKSFQKLHLLIDFENKYLTLDPNYLRNELKVFHQMLNQNLVYRDLKPIYWSWKSKTALAEAEITYQEAVDDSIYLRFPLNKELSFLIWTTTPWTLPANLAVALGKNIEYAVVEIDGKKLIVAKNLISHLSQILQKSLNYIKPFEFEKYLGKKISNPLNGEESLLVYGHHVSDQNGTGIVHIAGGHGEDDYLISKEHNLNLKVVVDDDGKMINSQEFNGYFYQDANKLIIKSLQEKNFLLKAEKIKHSIAVDWRTKTPVIFRATKQWFFANNKIKKAVLKTIKEVEWFPKWGGNRLDEMINNRGDWCISRQRLWGVPIPIIYDRNGQAIIDKELQNNIEDLIFEKGIIGWNDAKIADLLPNKIAFDHKMKKETDILDVWFDSGVSHLSVLSGKQADLYIEGSDQYRGWFNSSLLTSYLLNKKAPYKAVITHGFTVDEKGNKMSKSLGNIISPEMILKEYGSDLLRFWISTSNYFHNLKISKAILKNLSTDYKKIRNTLRFLLGNINDYDQEIPQNLSLISKAVLQHWGSLQKEFLLDFEKYNFANVLKNLLYELNDGAFAYYLEYVKDIIYIENVNNSARREAQYLLDLGFRFLLAIIAPFLPITVEDAWRNYPFKEKELFFETEFIIFKKQDSKLWKEFNLVRNSVNKAIEKVRSEKMLNRSSEAIIDLQLPQNYHSWEKKVIWKELLFVADVKISYHQNQEILVDVKKFNGIKCQRCWKYFSKSEINEEGICQRCEQVLKAK